ncbi:MAG: universal stress protein [Deltaproteobacteria bacterium]|jgi:universal stress protein A|nr:universal stress protein [Deltaproteobacteria bacterium]
MISIQNILVPVDLTQAAGHVAQYAAALAQAHQARLFVLHVKAPYPVHGRIAAGALEHVQNQRSRKQQTELSELIPDGIKDSIAVEEIQVTGFPMARVIVEKARELEIDVIVIPAQRPKGWLRFFRENVIQRVIRDAPCSVLVVRRPQDPTDRLNLGA